MYLPNIKCVVFDFAFTLSSAFYFRTLGEEALQTVSNVLFNNPDSGISSAWMTGEISSHDVAEFLSPYLSLPASYILDALRDGCANLRFNDAVLQFAIAQRRLGRKTALVTVNSDVFTDVVVPTHDLNSVFDAIVNSSDHGTMDKTQLWPIAFQRLGPGYGYHNSLLIEDNERMVGSFRSLGGAAHQYQNDESFLAWLNTIQDGEAMVS